jgi:hypothetical protein
MVVFVLLGFIHPIALLLIPPLTLAAAIVVSAGGVFLSSCFKRSSTSATFGLILFLAFCLPVCIFPAPVYLTSPIVVGGLMMSVTAGPRAAEPLSQLGHNFKFWGAQSGAAGAILAVLTISTLYLLIAFVCFALAGANLRHRIFRN